MQFRLDRRTVGNLALTYLIKDPATDIIEGSLVAKDVNGLAVTAGATSTAVAFAPFGAGTGLDRVAVVLNETELRGTGSRAFAQEDNGLVCDIAIAGWSQQIDLANSAVWVLKVVNDIYAWVVGSTNEIRVVIAKQL